MSDLRSMREGDTIIPFNSIGIYAVEDVDRLAGKVKARHEDGRRTKTFRASRLEEVDTGLWQEMLEARRGY